MDRKIELKMKTEKNIKFICGLIYAISLLLSVIYFEFRAKFLSDGMYSALSAYISVILMASLIGYKMAHWYIPVENSKPYMEFFLVPIVTTFTSIFSAGLCFGVVSKILRMSDYSIAEALGLGAYSAIVFILGVWPVLLACSVFASLVMLRTVKRF